MERHELLNLVRERGDRIVCVMGCGGGSIPVVTARGRSLAEAWENSLLGLCAYGCEVRTEYDARGREGKYLDPPSRDCTMVMVAEEPASEPMIHKAFPGGLEDLEEYRQEVLDGIKDHWVRVRSDPNDKRWEYTYHERLCRYTVPGVEGAVDQIEQVVEDLARAPHTRRAQAVIWKVWEDVGISDPACLQSFWFRIVPDENGVGRLNMNVRFRSRDGYDAAFMNAFAFVHLQEKIAGLVGKKRGEEICLGRYVDESDSYHIYGKRIADFEERFLGQLQTRSFEERTWTREFARPIFAEAKERIAGKVASYDMTKTPEGGRRIQGG